MIMNILATILQNLAILIGLFGSVMLIFKGISIIYSPGDENDHQNIGDPTGRPVEEPI